MKSSTYYFHIKTKILANFKICISVPLKIADVAALNKRDKKDLKENYRPVSILRIFSKIIERSMFDV